MTLNDSTKSDIPPASKTRTDSFYRPGLDLLRAFAFFSVFVAHGLVMYLDKPTRLGAVGRAGEFGVCIFFFLSSYLITELLLREKRDTTTILIPAFYMRRILRIWPLYFAMIAVGWLYGRFSPAHTLSVAWFLSLTLLSTNWYTANHGYPPGFLFPLWSISIEEQFYLLWPSIVKFLRPRGLFTIASMLMACAYVALAILLRQGAALDPGVWVNSLVQFQFFALGAMTAIVLKGRAPNIPGFLRWGLFTAGLLFLRGAQAAVYANDPNVPHDFRHIAPRYLIALSGCLCLFFSMLQIPSGRIQKPFIYLGKISYGLYVFHVLWLSVSRKLLAHFTLNQLSPISTQFCAMSLALPATIVTAMLSYRYLESPFLRFKKRFTVVLSRPI